MGTAAASRELVELERDDFDAAAFESAIQPVIAAGGDHAPAAEAEEVCAEPGDLLRRRVDDFDAQPFDALEKRRAQAARGRPPPDRNRSW